MTALGWQEARRLGHHWVGEEHMLLALSRGDGIAAEVLRSTGATPEAIEAELVHGLEHSDPPTEPRAVPSPSFNPAHYSARGRAEGLALGSGRRHPQHEDVLVALVWRPGRASGILHRLGVDRPRLVRALAARGVAVPPGEPEPLDLRPTRRIDVPFEHLSTIVSELPRRLPAGTRFGFNLDPDTERAWIFVGEEIDAEPVVAALLGEEDARDG